MNSLQLLLAHDLALTRSAFHLLLESEVGLRVVAEAETAQQLQEQLKSAHPDVILMVLSQRAGFGVALIEKLKRQHSKVKILVVSPRDDLSFVRLLLSAGAAGYVSERSGVTELRNALRELAHGQSYVDSSITEQADAATLKKINHVQGRSRATGFLSKRETEVLRMLAQGFTNQQVADALSLSVKTAETYRVRLTRKLGVKSRAELFRYAFEIGMVGPDQLVAQ